jgi:hypothetical protein
VKVPTEALELALIPKAAVANPAFDGTTWEGIETVRPAGEPSQLAESVTGELRPLMNVTKIVIEPLDP